MQILHTPVSMSNQNNAIEFAVACREKKIFLISFKAKR